MVDDVLAFDGLAEDGVLLVEEARIVDADVELRARGVRVCRAGHRDRALDVRLVVELGGELVTGAAGSGALGAAALDHELRFDPVELEAVVEAGAGELDERRAVLLGIVRIETEDDVPFLGLDACPSGFGLEGQRVEFGSGRRR